MKTGRVLSRAELLRAVRRAGWPLQRGAKHWIVYPPGRQQIVVSSSPSDRHAMRNVCAELRGAGLDI
jgi:hypothetical protein